MALTNEAYAVDDSTFGPFQSSLRRAAKDVDLPEGTPELRGFRQLEPGSPMLRELERSHEGDVRQDRQTATGRVHSRILMRSTAWWLLILMGGCDSPADRWAPSEALGDSTFLDPVQIIGLEAGDADYLFGAITSVASDIDGRVYVGDRVGATVRVFDSDGQFLHQVAREGEGPGEIYGWPADLIAQPDDRLWVRDGSRITVFGRSGAGSAPDSVVVTWATPGLGNLASTRSRLARDGKYYYPGYLFRQNESPRFFYLPLVGGTPVGDTLEVPPYPGLTGARTAILRFGPTGGMMLDGLNRVPFSAVPVWDVTPDGTLLSSDGASSRLIETDLDGDTLRTIRLPEARVRSLPPQERADSLQALEGRIEAIPGALAQVEGLGEGVQERRLPNSPPQVIGLHVALDGSIWVERWPPEGQGTNRFYDVFDGSGRPLEVVVLRAPIARDPPPWFGQGFIVGVIRDPTTGVERVVQFERPGVPSRASTAQEDGR